MDVSKSAGSPNRAASRLAIRRDEFLAWIDGATPGARVAYHRGWLNIDRTRGPSRFGEASRRELDAIADRAHALAEEGRLILIQKRHGDGDYSYLAILAKKESN